jgi:predicted Zn finger-like uncharacterized protein
MREPPPGTEEPVKDTCPVCATVFEVGSVADSVLGIPEILSFLVRCPTCSTEFPSDPRPERYDPGPIDPDDVLAPWHRDRALGIPEDRLPGYDAARATWTVYTHLIQEVKRDAADRLGAYLDTGS